MANRRERILQTAAQLFSRYGFRKTSIEDITRAAAISKGALYLEFGSKDELFDEVVVAEFLAYLDDVERRVLADPEGGRLSRMYVHSIRALLIREFLCALYTDTGGAFTGLLRQRGAERYRPRVLLGAHFIEQMQRAGLVRELPSPKQLSHTLTVLSIGPLLAEPLLSGDDSPALDDTLSAISKMIIDSYELPGGDVAAGKRSFLAMMSHIKEDIASGPTGSPGENEE